MPDVHIQSRDRFTSRCVDDLDVQCEWNALLVFHQVLEDQLPFDKVRTLGDVGLERTGRVVHEKDRLVHVQGHAGLDILVCEVVGAEIAPMDKRLPGKPSAFTQIVGQSPSTSNVGRVLASFP